MTSEGGRIDPVKAAIAALLFIAGGIAWVLLSGDRSTHAERARVRIRYSVAIQNQTNEIIEDQIAIFLPAHALGTGLSADGKVVRDTEGNQDLLLPVKVVPFGNATIPLEIRELASPDTNSIQPGRYISSEELIEADAPEIRSVVTLLQEDRAQRSYSSLAFDWVVSNIRKAPYSAAAKGARAALLDKEGDCTDMTALFVALMRGAGVPARAISGFISDKSAGVLQAADYHNWAEFFDGSRWRLADPYRNLFDTDGADLIPFRMGKRALSDPPFRGTGKKLRISLR